jgi:hypothetical protein
MRKIRADIQQSVLHRLEAPRATESLRAINEAYESFAGSLGVLDYDYFDC